MLLTLRSVCARAEAHIERGPRHGLDCAYEPLWWGCKGVQYGHAANISLLLLNDVCCGGLCAGLAICFQAATRRCFLPHACIKSDPSELFRRPSCTKPILSLGEAFNLQKALKALRTGVRTSWGWTLSEGISSVRRALEELLFKFALGLPCSTQTIS